METPNINLDDFIKDIQDHIEQKYKVKISPEKVKGLAFSTLKELGVLSQEDRYKTYEHVGKMLKIMNEGLGGDVFDWEDIEAFTGNLFYTMRLATRRPIDEVLKLQNTYRDNKQLNSDFQILILEIKKNMTKTWDYLEKIQLIGAGNLVNKFLKYLLKLNKDEISGSKKQENIQQPSKG